MKKFKVMFAPRNLLGMRVSRRFWINVKEFPGEYSRAEVQRILDNNEKLEIEYSWKDGDYGGGELVGVPA